jgi:hypothetical protein
VTDRPTGLGLGDVLTVREAVAALRVREATGRAWLREHRLIVEVAGVERVVWGDVLSALRRGAPKDGPTRRGRARGRLPYEEVRP